MAMFKYKKMILFIGGEVAYLELKTKLSFRNMVLFISIWEWEIIMESIMEAMSHG